MGPASRARGDFARNVLKLRVLDLLYAEDMSRYLVTMVPKIITK